MSKQTLEERCDRLTAALSETLDQKEALEVELANVKEELSTLVSWVMGDGADALTVLQRLYLNTEEAAVNRIKAAAAAIGFERAKPAATTVVLDFRERVRRARLAADAKLLAEPKVIEHIPSDTSEPASAS